MPHSGAAVAEEALHVSSGGAGDSGVGLPYLPAFEDSSATGARRCRSCVAEKLKS